jgi:hypothetical protein
MNMSFMASSIGIISHFIPVGVIVQVILHIIIAIGIMLPIGIMPPIIGMFIGIMFIGIIFIGIMGIGIAAFMGDSISLRRDGVIRRSQHRYERPSARSTTNLRWTLFSSATLDGAP